MIYLAGCFFKQATWFKQWEYRIGSLPKMEESRVKKCESLLFSLYFFFCLFVCLIISFGSVYLVAIL